MKSASSRSAKRRTAKQGSSSRVSRTDLARVRALSGKEVKLSAEHPEARLKHVVRGIARVGLKLVPAKTAISLRVDQEVLDWFKSQGEGYQTRMNAVLKAFFEASR